MAGESLPQRLANDVAEAADAWLRDPRDTGVYTRLVQAVERWRMVTRPTLDRAHDSEGWDDGEDGDDYPPGHHGPVPIARTIDEVRRSLPAAPDESDHDAH